MNKDGKCMQEYTSPGTELVRSAFIVKPKKGRNEVEPTEYSIEHAFPILSGFTIAMAQARRNTLDLTSATITTLKQPQTGTLHPRILF